MGKKKIDRARFFFSLFFFLSCDFVFSPFSFYRRTQGPLGVCGSRLVKSSVIFAEFVGSCFFCADFELYNGSY